MPRILAIDYGTKRTGLAVTDPGNIIATGLATVKTAEVIDFLKEYLGRESVSCFVVGEPRMMNNQPSPVAQAVEKFVGILKKNFPLIPVEREDERFTSLMAQRSLLEGGLKKSDRQNKEYVDLASAVLILQSWMERKARSADNRGGQQL